MADSQARPRGPEHLGSGCHPGWEKACFKAPDSGVWPSLPLRGSEHRVGGCLREELPAHPGFRCFQAGGGASEAEARVSPPPARLHSCRCYSHRVRTAGTGTIREVPPSELEFRLGDTTHRWWPGRKTWGGGSEEPGDASDSEPCGSRDPQLSGGTRSRAVRPGQAAGTR